MLKTEKRKQAYQMIEFVLTHQRAIREAVMEVRLDRAKPVDENVGGGRPSTTSDPTAAQAIANATPLKSVTLRDGTSVAYPEVWLAVANKTREHCDDTERQVFDAHFVERMSVTRMETDLGIPRSSFFYLTKVIRRHMLELALQAGLVKVA